MRFILLCCACLISAASAFSQEPLTAPLPTKFDGLLPEIQVGHFPSPVFASTDPEDPGVYFWKHNTTVLSPVENATVIEGGAYIYYNDQWNVRVIFSAKEFSELYGIPNNRLNAGEPYTFVKNWRTDSAVRGGWAMWYIIAKTDSGKTIYGVGKLETAGSTYQAD